MHINSLQIERALGSQEEGEKTLSFVCILILSVFIPTLCTEKQKKN